MKCTFCGSDMIESKKPCIFCNGKGCGVCNNTGKLTIVQCSNSNCVLPDFEQEPWDDETEED